MKFKEFVALCNKLELAHPECGEFNLVVGDGISETDIVPLFYINMPSKLVLVGAR